MMKLIRLEQSEQGAIGVLLIDEEVFCMTLEPDSNDQSRSQIPAGIYKCQRFHGLKWPDTFEIIVPGHEAVLFHAGNVEKDTQMCVILGQYVGYIDQRRAVLSSYMAFGRFMKKMERVQYFDIEIIDFYKGAYHGA